MCPGTMGVPIQQAPTLLWEEEPTSPGVLVAKWLEYPTGRLKEVVGSLLPGTLKILSLVPSTVAKQPSLKVDFLSCMAGKNLKRLIRSTMNSNIYATE